MKIAIIVSKLTGGGAERVAALWATGFARRGHEVSLIVYSKAKSEISYEVPRNIKIYSLGANINHRKLRALCNILKFFIKSRKNRLGTILHEIRPDMIIGVIHPWAWDAYNVTRDMNVRIVNTEHNSFERPVNIPMSTDVEKQKFEINKSFDHVTVLTQADKNVIGNRLNNVSVLPNPLSFNPVVEISEKKNVILASGRLDVWETKGFDLLIKAFGQICVQHSSWVLQIAGTGKRTSLRYLQELAEECNIPKKQIEFLGFRDDMKLLYQRSSIFVLSSRCEGFGMVLIEAMSQGCACIACDYKGRQSEIIEDETQGILCPTDDVESLAKAIEKMIKDEQYRKLCQHNAIERSKYYSLDKTIDRWENIFNKINKK